MKTISIITNTTVDKTFEGVDCKLKRTIISTHKENKKRVYTVLTERVIESTRPIPDLDGNGDLQFDGNGDIIMTTEPYMKVLGQKDSLATVVMTEAEINGLYAVASGNGITLSGNTYTNFINELEQEGLLIKTQQDQPWGTTAGQWIKYND